MTIDALSASNAELDRGEYLAAYEVALQDLEAGPHQTQSLVTNLQHTVVLALARMGATRQARKLYADYELADVLEMDAQTLGARLLKDLALSEPSKKRKPFYLSAAIAYEKVYQDFGRDHYYPAVNAASLYALAGNDQRAKELAAATAVLCEQQKPDYWSLASLAEARLVLGELERCKTALQRATLIDGADTAKLAVTLKQLKMLKASDDVLAMLALPTIAHFAGHIIGSKGQSSRFPSDQESEVSEKIALLVKKHNVMIGYGSLAAGADMLFAEAILARGGEINIVLPFNKTDFITASVLPSGHNWLTRFERCLKSAATVTFSTTGHFGGNNTLFHNCSQYAMGLACLRQSHLDSPVMQLLVWDGEPTNNLAGTAGDHATWTKLGYDSHVISIQGTRDKDEHTAELVKPTHQNELRAVVFGDIAGFSKLTDIEIPLFVKHVMGTLAEALEEVNGAGDAGHRLSVNTWGDGIFMVFDDAYFAARCACHLLETLAKKDFRTVGIEQQPQLRLGANYGPVYQFHDPITKRINFFGHQVNTAARIEPVAPLGEVYVTESFAAQLALSSRQGFAAEYVGKMELAKKFGKSRMYLLKPAT